VGRRQVRQAAAVLLAGLARRAVAAGLEVRRVHHQAAAEEAAAVPVHRQVEEAELAVHPERAEERVRRPPQLPERRQGCQVPRCHQTTQAAVRAQGTTAPTWHTSLAPRRRPGQACR